MNWRRRVSEKPSRDVSRGTSRHDDATESASAGAVGSATGARAGDRAARVVCVTNQKGGVGKTTTAVSVGAALAEMGLRVLLVDLDPQGNASTGLNGRAVQGQASTYDVLVDKEPARDAIVATDVEDLDLLPSSIDLAGAEVELVAQLNRERRLKQALDGVQDTYHVILVDCPPSLGILTLNALVAADEAMVPIQTEYYALEGVTQLLRTLDLVQEDLNPALHIGAVVLTMYDARTNLSKQVADEIRGHFEDATCDTVIPRSVRLSEAPSFGQPITIYDGSSTGAQAYRRLARELAARWSLGDAHNPLNDLLRSNDDQG